MSSTNVSDEQNLVCLTLLFIIGVPVQKSGLAFMKRNVNSGLVSPPHPGFNSPGLYKSTSKAMTKVVQYQTVSKSLNISSRILSTSIKSSPSTHTKASTSAPSSTALRFNQTYGTSPLISAVSTSAMVSSGRSALTSVTPSSSTTLSKTLSSNQTYGSGQVISGVTPPVIIASGLPTALPGFSTARSDISNIFTKTRLLSTANSVSPSSSHLSTTKKHLFPCSTDCSIITSSHSTLNTAIGSSRLESKSLRTQTTNTGSADRLNAGLYVLHFTVTEHLKITFCEKVFSVLSENCLISFYKWIICYTDWTGKQTIV